MVGETYHLSQSRSEDLIKTFYLYYDEDYWSTKLHLYNYLVNNIRSIAEDIEYLDTDDVEHYERLLNSEFMYIFYHSTEALLSLVRSLQKGGFPWVDMKNTYTGDIDNFVKNELSSDSIADNLKDIFYFSAEIQSDSEKQIIADSCDFIAEYLQKIGRIFSNDRSPYNEYKHGLRMITSTGEVELSIDDNIETNEDLREGLEDIDRNEDGDIILAGMSGDVLRYIYEVDMNNDRGQEFTTLALGMRPIAPQYYFDLAHLNNQLMSQIFSTRRTAFNINVGEQEESTVKMYNETSIDDVFSREDDLVDFSANYNPLGNDDVFTYESK